MSYPLTPPVSTLVFAKGQFDFLFTDGGANAGMMAPTKSPGHLGSPNLRSHKEVAGMWICMKKPMLQPGLFSDEGGDFSKIILFDGLNHGLVAKNG